MVKRGSSNSSGKGSGGNQTVSSAKSSANARSNAHNPTAKAYNPTVRSNTGGSTARSSHNDAARNNNIVRNAGEN